MSAKSYRALQESMLALGMRSARFTIEKGLLVRDFGECVGGIEFQRSKYNPDEFFVNVGIISKRVDEFFKDEYRNEPWSLRCHLGCRLEDIVPSPLPYCWRTTPTADVAATLAKVILQHAIPFFERFSTDSKLKSGLLRGSRKLKYHLLAGDSELYAAIIAKHKGDAKAFEHLAKQAREQAKKSANEDWVVEQLERLVAGPILPEDTNRATAIEQLKRITGRDFGDDEVAWRAWLREKQSHSGADGE